MGSIRLRRLSVLLVVLVALPALGACGGGGSKKQAASSTTTASTAPASTTSSTEAKPDQSPKAVALNEVFKVEDFEVTVHEVKIPVTSSNQFEQPIPGTVLVGLDTEAKNTGAASKKFSPDVALLDNANREFLRVNTSIVPESPTAGEIPPASAKRGIMTFQVLEGAQAAGLRLVIVPDKDVTGFVIPLVAGGTPPTPPAVASTDPAKVFAKDEGAPLGDWGVMVFHGVTNPYTTTDKYDQPDAGMRFVVAEVEFFNTSKQNQYTSNLDGSIQDAMNQTYRTSSKNPVNLPEEAIGTAIIAPGLALRGPVVFQIPEAAAGGPLKMLISFHSKPVVFSLS